MGIQQRILLIDDESDTLALCQRLLQTKGYHVKTHLGCDDLMKVVETFSPHLIFMDHNMPQLCGADAIQLLKADIKFKHIPVILFSADSHIEQLAKEAGADGWLKKPFQFETMAVVAEKMTLAG